jgi:predicted nucleic acid-binding protein
MTVNAVLDACVLYPAALVDILLRAAMAGLYLPFWSADILAELERNLVLRLGAAPAQQRVAAMREHFGDAEVVGYATLTRTMTNHPKDRHVLAAAVKAGAQVVVTDNLKDFPATALRPHGITVQSADTFLLGLYAQAPGQLVTEVIKQASALSHPAMTVSQVLAQLGKQALWFWEPSQC